jgi:CMP-N-acetylneuraminic acid synthetase
MNVLVHVPARAGSKGLPGKNLRTVGGISLVGRAILAGRAFLEAYGLNGTVLLDTDGAEIADEGRRHGAEVPFLRPPELAADGTSSLDTVLHAVDRLASSGRTFDALVLLQPTSPLRTAADIGLCWDAFDPVRAPSVISVCAPDHPPELTLRSREGVLSWAFGAPAEVRRQAARPAWRPTGAVYIQTVAFLREAGTFIADGRTIGVELPRACSVDVDEELDLHIAEAILNWRTDTR